MVARCKIAQSSIKFPLFNGKMKIAIYCFVTVDHVCMFGLRLYVQVNNSSVMSGRFPGLNQY